MFIIPRDFQAQIAVNAIFRLISWTAKAASIIPQYSVPCSSDPLYSLHLKHQWADWLDYLPRDQATFVSYYERNDQSLKPGKGEGHVSHEYHVSTA